MEYNIKRTNAESVEAVDWSKADKMVLQDNNGGVSKYATIARLCYNDEGIFFRFECEDDIINATMTGYNQPIYDEETVEFFFSSGGDIRYYLELEWNALGAEFAANIYNDMQGSTRLTFVEKNILTSKVESKGKDWSVTGFIPKELFEGATDGVWKFNAYRIKRREDNSMILMAYSPTFIENFHKPQYFADLIFES